MARRQPLFLERSSYRRRRLGDAARILPVLGLALVLVPVWWFPARVSLTGGAIWLFGLWAGLIVMIAALHAALGLADRAARRSGGATAAMDDGGDIGDGGDDG